MKAIAVFCGSREGNNPDYRKAAIILGEKLAKNKISLIYGGGKVGLMGIIADTVLKNGGEVMGVIPRFLYDREVGHDGVSKLILTDSMHERKSKMSTLADAFIALPGGFGTLEELAEIITWNQLDLVNKPIGLLNTNNYYKFLLNYFDQMVESDFVDVKFRNQIIESSDPGQLVDHITDQNYKPAVQDNLSKT